MRRFISVLKITSSISLLLIVSSFSSHWINVEYFAKEFIVTFYPKKELDQLILVSIGRQKLYLMENYSVKKEYPISSSKYGIGSQAGSYKTPIGLFEIPSLHGDKEPVGRVFINAEPTNDIAAIYVDSSDVAEDKVLTRVIKLKGLENGINTGPGHYTYNRKIYIHGTPEEGLIGTPASHGCIRMLNHDIVDLFDRINPNFNVLIVKQ